MYARWISLILILVGTNVLTYAYTRANVTRRTARAAEQLTEEFLREKELFSPRAPATSSEASDRQDSTWLMIQIRNCGGQKYWHNRAALFYSIGVSLVLLGLLLPIVQRRFHDKRRRSSRSSGVIHHTY